MAEPLPGTRKALGLIPSTKWGQKSTTSPHSHFTWSITMSYTYTENRSEKPPGAWVLVALGYFFVLRPVSLGKSLLQLRTKLYFSPGHKLDRCPFSEPFKLKLRFNTLQTTKATASFPGKDNALYCSGQLILQTQLTRQEKRGHESHYPQVSSDRKSVDTGSHSCYFRWH